MLFTVNKIELSGMTLKFGELFNRFYNPESSFSLHLQRNFELILISNYTGSKFKLANSLIR